MVEELRKMKKKEKGKKKGKEADLPADGSEGGIGNIAHHSVGLDRLEISKEELLPPSPARRK